MIRKDRILLARMRKVFMRRKALASVERDNMTIIRIMGKE